MVANTTCSISTRSAMKVTSLCLAFSALCFPATSSAGLLEYFWNTTTSLIEDVVEAGSEIVDTGTAVVGTAMSREPDKNGYYSKEQQAMNLIDPPKPNNPVDSSLRERLKLNDGTPVIHFGSNRHEWKDGFAKRWYGSYQVVTLDGDATGAKCADGSNYKFMVDRSVKSSNMMIYFEGGAGCWNESTCGRPGGGVTNAGVAGSALGSDIPVGVSLRLGAQLSLMSGIADDVDTSFNPKYRDWTKVYLTYCSQDLGAGDVVRDYGLTHENGSTTYQHNGRKINGAVLTWLKENLEQPQQILLAGQSAGGFSSMLNYHLYRTALAPQKAYLYSDAGAVVPADQNDSFAEAPTAKTMMTIRKAWNVTPYLRWLEEESERVNLNSKDRFTMNDMGTLNTFLSKRWPNDRFMLAVAQHDNISGNFAYKYTDERIEKATTKNDAISLSRMKQEREMGKLKTLLDGLPNFGYFMPGYRPFLSGHVLSLPIVAASAKNEDDGNTVRSSILNLLDDHQPLMKSYESNVFLDYARYHDCANAFFAYNDRDLNASQDNVFLTMFNVFSQLPGCALPVRIRPEIRNLAEGKSSTQSSTAFGGGSGRAVDGITSGDWRHGSVTHTAKERNPWWLVDLGSRKTVYGVTLWNRTDCCSDRLSNFRLTYLNNDMQIVDIKDYPHKAGTKTNIVSMKSGVRYVRVELLGSGVLSLAELQVWGHWDDQSFSSEYIPPYGAQWIYCANEDQQCDFKGSRVVRYGKHDAWHYETHDDGVGCNNSEFGDPLSGVFKECAYLKEHADGIIRIEIDDSYLQLQEVEIKMGGTWYFLNGDAFHAVLTAKDEYNADAVASKAGDGNKNGAIYHSGTNTGTVWWQANITKLPSPIEEVRIKTRTDDYAWRIDGARVLLGTSDHLQEIGTWEWDGDYTKTFTGNVNIALGKTVSQSSTAHGGAASRAVDGNTSGQWGHGSVTHTGNEHRPWWEVNLDGPKTISGITLWNRTDCCTQRLSNFEVLISTEMGPVSLDYSGTTVDGKFDIPFNLEGVYSIKVRLNGTGILSLAEVQVWGQEEQFYTASTPANADGGWNNRNTIFLDRHELNCGSFGLKGFKLYQPTTTQIAYDYACINVNDSGVSGWNSTPANAWGNGHNAYLDRHGINCGDKPIKAFRLTRPSESQLSYAYKCGSARLSQISNHYTGWNDNGDGNAIFLDRHNVSCPAGRALTYARLQNNGNGEMRYHYKCGTP